MRLHIIAYYRWYDRAMMTDANGRYRFDSNTTDPMTGEELQDLRLVPALRSLIQEWRESDAATSNEPEPEW